MNRKLISMFVEAYSDLLRRDSSWRAESKLVPKDIKDDIDQWIDDMGLGESDKSVVEQNSYTAGVRADAPKA